MSRYGILPLAFSLDHAGPLAWTVEDGAILLEAMAGYDPQDPACANRPVPAMRVEFERGVAGMRVGVVRHFHETDNPVSAETMRGIDSALATLEREGAIVTEITLQPLMEWTACSTLITFVEAYDVHEKRMRENLAGFGELLRDRCCSGSARITHALRRRRELCASLLWRWSGPCWSPRPCRAKRRRSTRCRSGRCSSGPHSRNLSAIHHVVCWVWPRYHRCHAADGKRSGAGAPAGAHAYEMAAEADAAGSS